jgi:hypothetical protein
MPITFLKHRQSMVANLVSYYFHDGYFGKHHRLISSTDLAALGAIGHQRFSAAWAGFAPMLARWLTVTEGRGPAAVQQIYLDTLNGRVPPQQGHILSLAE